ncbi:MAG: CBS domain-containing protein [Spirochaetales bacterium]|nr:CBS domain-containing protein [Spirochaetales bacterium]
MDTKGQLAATKVKDVRNFLVKKPATVKSSASTTEILKSIIADTRTRHLYVVDNSNRLIGSVQLNDVVKFLFPWAAAFNKYESVVLKYNKIFIAKTAEDIMRTDPLYVYETDSLEDTTAAMVERKINELPVINKNRVIIGQINMYKIIEAYLKIIRAE